MSSGGLEPDRPRFAADTDGGFLIDIHSSLKNYDNEIGKFLDWIAPYLQPAEPPNGLLPLGFSHYEEDEYPEEIAIDSSGTVLCRYLPLLRDRY